MLGIAAASLAGAAPAALPRASFEEEARPGMRPHYVWRHNGIVASLDSGAGFAIRIPGRREIGITFVGAAAQALPQGESQSGYRINYYLGPRRQWHSSTGYERVRYSDIYPGIDLIFLTKQNQLEYDFELRPGADPRQIRIRYRGGNAALDRDGNIQFGNRRRGMKQLRPTAFQTDPADTHPIACGYQLSGNELTLRLGRYDPSRLLKIDPVVQFSTYLGGPYFDAIYAAAADSAGNVYVTGETNSGSIPGGSLPALSSRDVWIAKINNTGNQLLYLTYLGGSADDAGKGIAVDSAGNAYVTGNTASTDFPTTSGGLNRTNAGSPDAFAAKLNSSGQLQYSTFLGAAASTYGLAIAVDGTGAAYVAGQTSATSFPTTSGVFDTSYNGGLSDCFVSKLNSAASSLVYSTYLGGSGLDLCAGIALDSSGDAYVTGTTSSSNFPLQDAIQSNLGGSATAFAAEINPYGSALLYSTLLGGSVLDNGNAIAVDSTGAAYVAGCTSSPDFPTTVGAFQTTLNGAYNGFVIKLSAAPASLVYSTLMGGSGTDTVTALTVDGSGQAVIAGYTSSPNFPLANATQPAFQGVFDAFAAVLNNSGTGLIFSSYLGGSGDDRGFGVAVTPGNQMFVAGMTASANFPTAAALQNTLSGEYDGFISQIQYVDAFLLVPLPPCRVADTRVGESFTWALGPPYLAGGTARSFPVLSSSCGVPATAQAYSLNITVFPRTGSLEFLTVWPTNGPFPNASTLNSLDGRWVANATIMPAGTGGAISIYASNDTDLVIDINGYFDHPSNAEGLSFYSLTPCRIADTRTGQGKTGAFGPPYMAGGTSRSFPVPTSGCSVPAAAQVYSLNITALPRTSELEFLTVWGTGTPFPTVSTLNSITGIVVANAAMVQAGTGGAISVYVTNDTDLIIDINGYFGARGSPGALQFFALNPCRVADTRASQGKTGPFGPPSIAADTYRAMPVPLSGCPAPTWAGAYDLNVTALPSTDFLGYVTVWPAGQPEPNVSTLNSWTGTVVANAALVPSGTAGAIDIFASDTTDIIIDLNGYFGP